MATKEHVNYHGARSEKQVDSLNRQAKAGRLIAAAKVVKNTQIGRVGE